MDDLVCAEDNLLCVITVHRGRMFLKREAGNCTGRRTMENGLQLGVTVHEFMLI